jgi:hypothetical protein
MAFVDVAIMPSSLTATKVYALLVRCSGWALSSKGNLPELKLLLYIYIYFLSTTTTTTTTTSNSIAKLILGPVTQTCPGDWSQSLSWSWDLVPGLGLEPGLCPRLGAWALSQAWVLVPVRGCGPILVGLNKYSLPHGMAPTKWCGNVNTINS